MWWRWWCRKHVNKRERDFPWKRRAMLMPNIRNYWMFPTSVLTHISSSSKFCHSSFCLQPFFTAFKCWNALQIMLGILFSFYPAPKYPIQNYDVNDHQHGYLVQTYPLNLWLAYQTANLTLSFEYLKGTLYIFTMSKNVLLIFYKTYGLPSSVL